MNIDYHWDSEIPVKVVSRPWLVDGRWLLTEGVLAYYDEPVEWNMSIEDALSYPRVWLVAQDAFGPEEFTESFIEASEPRQSQRLGPFVVYLFAP